MRSKITFERLKEVLQYEPISGVFIRNGKVTGMIHSAKDRKTYLEISIDSVTYKAHRLAWLYMTGALPEDQMDHIDGDGLNNKWNNLRAVTQAENAKNLKMYSTNTSGRTGVQKRRSGKWVALIRVDRKLIYLGTFAKFPEAASAREEAEKKYGFHQNHGSVRPW